MQELQDSSNGLYRPVLPQFIVVHELIHIKMSTTMLNSPNQTSK